MVQGYTDAQLKMEKRSKTKNKETEKKENNV